jgi:ABC-2 type transport system ATP-binding protein
MGAAPAIAIEGLTKRYGAKAAVENLTLSVSEGELFGFLGPNGAGKSTTIRVLLALLRATSGHASVLGFDCWRHSRQAKAEIGYIPGDFRFYSGMNGRDALSLFGRVRGRDLRKAGDDLAQLFGLDLSLPSRAMSRGTRQKLGLLLALAHDPKVLVLDEPTTALDPIAQKRLCDLLRQRAANGTTVFFSSHTLNEVEDLCDTVAAMREGKLVACEKLAAMRERARRVAKLRWKNESDAVAAHPPAFLALVAREGRDWIGTLHGEAMDLVRWAAERPLEDFEVDAPDLDSLFHQFYRAEKAAESGAARP